MALGRASAQSRIPHLADKKHAAKEQIQKDQHRATPIHGLETGMRTRLALGRTSAQSRMTYTSLGAELVASRPFSTSASDFIMKAAGMVISECHLHASLALDARKECTAGHACRRCCTMVICECHPCTGLA